MWNSAFITWSIQASIFLYQFALIWAKKVQYNVEEESKIGTVVGMLRDHVPNSYENLQFVTVQEHDNTAFSLFNIDRLTGVIRVADRIDREMLCKKQLFLDGNDLLGCRIHFNVNCLKLQSTGSPLNGKLIMVFDIVINILDINDNTCTFVPSNRQTITIREDVPWEDVQVELNTPVDEDSVTLGHSVNLNSIRFAPTSSSPSDISNYYAISEAEFRKTFLIYLTNASTQVKLTSHHHQQRATSGFSVQLKLLRALDYEKRQNYTFDLIADDADGLNQVKEHQCRLTVVILVEDCNDNSPQFEQQYYRTNLSEKAALGSVVLRFSAQDADSGENGQILYEIQGANPETLNLFHLEASSGILRLQQRPNFRSIPLHTFNVIAKNPVDKNMSPQKMMLAEAHVAIQILDENDHAPVIKIYSPMGSSSLEVLEESAVGQDIAIVDVTDEDTGSNARITCSIKNQSTEGSLKLTKLEGSQEIGRERFKITLLKTVNREEMTYFDFTMRCQDDGHPSLLTDVSKRIKIVDINDNTPMFERNMYFVQITEDSDTSRLKDNYEILKLIAMDADEDKNSQIRYSIVDEGINQKNKWFTIDPKTGLLSSTGSVDREIHDQVVLTVMAKDEGEPQLSTTVTVHIEILDYNDNPPTFSHSTYTFHVQENRPVGYLIGTISMWDNDIDKNAEVQVIIDDIKYPSLSLGNTEHRIGQYEHVDREKTDAKFRIVSFPMDSKLLANGNRTQYEIQLYTTSELDREMYIKHGYDARSSSRHSDIDMHSNRSEPTNAFILIRLRAEDKGIPRLSNVASVCIVLVDENDNAPVFQFPDPNSANVSTASVSYKESVDTVVTKVFARDPDAGENGTVRYFIREAETIDQYFAIDTNTGVIRLNRELNSRLIGEHLIDLEARDCGRTSRSNFARMIIVINDFPPKNVLPGIMDGWGLHVGGNDHVFNLYILITVVLASCVISGLLLSFICFLLKRNKLSNGRLVNGQLPGGHTMKRELTADSNTSVKMFNSTIPSPHDFKDITDGLETKFSTLPLQPYNSLYHDFQEIDYPDFQNTINRTVHMTSPEITRAPATYQTPYRIAENGVVTPNEAMDVCFAPYKNDSLRFQIVHNFPTNANAMVPSGPVCLTLPKSMIQPECSQLDKPQTVMTGATQTNSIQVGGPWCAFVNVESNSVRSTDCDSGHGDSLEVVPCVGLSYLTRMQMNSTEAGMIPMSTFQ